MKFQLKFLFITLLFCFITIIACTQPDVTIDSSCQIAVDSGLFSSPEQAAFAEQQIDWSGQDTAAMRACTECFAAVELKNYLSAITESNDDKNAFKIVSFDQAAAGNSIVLTSLSAEQTTPIISKIIKKYKLENKLEKNESFAIITNSDKVYIIGKDRTGTLYGVYHFLEKIGVRWFEPGKMGEEIPKADVITVQAINEIQSPHFISRGFWAWEDRGNTDFYLWMARNKLNYWTIAEPNRAFLRKIGIQLTFGGHKHFERFLNPDEEYPYNHPLFKGDEKKADDPYSVSKAEYKGDVNRDGKLSYFEAHPEWYGLIDGKRTPFEGEFGTNICTSNNDAIQELCYKLVDELAVGEWRDAGSLNFWPIDGGEWCECEKCKPLGTPTDRLLVLVNQVHQAIEKAQERNYIKRDVKIVFPIYHETLSPPTRPLPQDFDYDDCIGTYFPIERCYVHVLDDSNCTEYNAPLWEDFIGWIKTEPVYYKGQFFIGEYYNVSRIKSLPVLYTRIMPHDLLTYYNYGARHCHYMHVYTKLWGMKRINNYLFAKLLWDVNTDTDHLLDDYFNRFYGNSALDMKELYDKMEYAMSSIKQWRHYYHLADQIDKDLTPLFHLEHLKLKEYHPEKNDGVDLEESVLSLKECRKIMDTVIKSNNTANLVTRLSEDDQNLRYAENTVNFYYYVSQAIEAERAENLTEARDFFTKSIPFARALQAETEIVQTSSSHANAKNGLEATRIENKYREMGKRLAPGFRL